MFRVTISFLEIYMEHITDLLVVPDFKSHASSGNRSHSAFRNSSTSSLMNANNVNQAGQNLQIREDPKTGIFVHGLT